RTDFSSRSELFPALWVSRSGRFIISEYRKATPDVLTRSCKRMGFSTASSPDFYSPQYPALPVPSLHHGACNVSWPPLLLGRQLHSSFSSSPSVRPDSSSRTHSSSRWLRAVSGGAGLIRPIHLCSPGSASSAARSAH